MSSKRSNARSTRPDCSGFARASDDVARRASTSAGLGMHRAVGLQPYLARQRDHVGEDERVQGDPLDGHVVEDCHRLVVLAAIAVRLAYRCIQHLWSPSSPAQCAPGPDPDETGPSPAAPPRGHTGTAHTVSAWPAFTARSSMARASSSWPARLYILTRVAYVHASGLPTPSGLAAIRPTRAAAARVSPRCTCAFRSVLYAVAVTGTPCACADSMAATTASACPSRACEGVAPPVASVFRDSPSVSRAHRCPVGHGRCWQRPLRPCRC